MIKIEYDFLEELCIFLGQKEEEIELHFISVLEIIYIEGKEYMYSPFVVKIRCSQLHEYLFEEYERGVNRE